MLLTPLNCAIHLAQRNNCKSNKQCTRKTVVVIKFLMTQSAITHFLSVWCACSQTFVKFTLKFKMWFLEKHYFKIC